MEAQSEAEHAAAKSELQEVIDGATRLSRLIVVAVEKLANVPTDVQLAVFRSHRGAGSETISGWGLRGPTTASTDFDQFGDVLTADGQVYSYIAGPHTEYEYDPVTYEITNHKLEVFGGLRSADYTEAIVGAEYLRDSPRFFHEDVDRLLNEGQRFHETERTTSSACSCPRV